MIAKNDDPDKYKYTGHGFAFKVFIYRRKHEKIVIIFGACMSSCVHIDNKNKDILFLGEGTTEGLDDVTLTAGAKHPINFTKTYK